MALLPMLVALPAYALTARSHRAGGILCILAGFASVAMGLALVPRVVHGPVEFTVGAMGYGVHFRADAFGTGIALLAALGWSLAMLYSMDYMAHGHSLPRYWAFMLFTMGATTGVFLSADLFTLFIFFELMTFASYALVVHEETPEAMAAGKTFLYMGVVGGLCLVFAIMILGYVSGTGLDGSLAGDLLSSGYFPLVTVLALLGFGMKAGMVPLHIWLPQAHPVAPAPASAVLSGVLIKAGAYGLIRVFFTVLGPGGHSQIPQAFSNGLTLLGIGIATMIAGGFMALFQTNAKRVLAYSSISQMGYILTGVGAGAILGLEGAMGFGGAFYHMMNHVVFKAAAFMTVGYVYMKTHSLDLTKLSGLWRSMPVAAVTFVLVFGAITGLPGFSGFGSKTMIHHALTEAYHETHLASLHWAEWGFTLGSALTAVYFIRLGGIFFGHRRCGHIEVRGLRLAEASLIALALLILLVGLFPDFLMDALVFPAVEALGFDHHALEHLHHLRFFAWRDIRDVLKPLGLGILIYLGAWRTGLFSRARFPAFLSVEWLVYRPIAWASTLASAGAGRLAERALGRASDAMTVALAGAVSFVGRSEGGFDRLYSGLHGLAMAVVRHVSRVEEGVNMLYSVASEAADTFVNKTGDVDEKLNKGYARASRAAMGLAGGVRDLDKAVDAAYVNLAKRAKEAVSHLDDEPSPEPKPRVWTPWNLNLGSLLLALTLTALGAMLLLSGTLR
jgi:formate hydrogenlyase subunit 3/multisubunit Na+/H+ antiporter MnhD subunit